MRGSYRCLGMPLDEIPSFAPTRRAENRNVTRRLIRFISAFTLPVLLGACSSNCLKIQQCSDGIFGRSCSMVCPPSR